MSGAQSISWRLNRNVVRSHGHTYVVGSWDTYQAIMLRRLFEETTPADNNCDKSSGSYGSASLEDDDNSHRAEEAAAAAASSSSSYVYYHFHASPSSPPIEDMLPIILRQDPRKGIAHQLWPAAVFLSEYLQDKVVSSLEYPPHETTILELGAGIGLCGLVCHRLNYQHVVMTDLPVAIPLLEANIGLNLHIDGSGDAFGNEGNDDNHSSISTMGTCASMHLHPPRPSSSSSLVTASSAFFNRSTGKGIDVGQFRRARIGSDRNSNMQE